MNKYLLGAAFVLALLTNPANAVPFNADFGTGQANVTAGSSQGTPNSGTNFADVFAPTYQGITPGGSVWSDDANGPLVSCCSVSGQYKSPFANTGSENTNSYFSVGGGVGAEGDPGSPVTLSLLSGYASSARILWGSIDSYNTLEFLRDGVSISTFLGASVAGNVPVSGFNGTNFEKVALLEFSNFTSGLGGLLLGFNGVRFSSGQQAFEFGLSPNSISTLGAVPIPAALPLFGTALGGLFLLKHKKARKQAQDAAAA